MFPQDSCRQSLPLTACSALLQGTSESVPASLLMPPSSRPQRPLLSRRLRPGASRCVSYQPTAGSGDEGFRQSFYACEVASSLGLEGVSHREMRKCAFLTPSPPGDGAAKRRNTANGAAATARAFPSNGEHYPKDDGENLSWFYSSLLFTVRQSLYYNIVK